MSDYHILTASEKDHELTVAFHIAVPDANNSVGYSYRTALVQSAAPTSVVPFIEEAEAAQIAAGAVFEHVETVGVNAALSDAAKQAIIDARWTALSTAALTALQKRLKYYGRSRDVPA